VRNQISKVILDDNETTITQYQYELYICKNRISLALKQAPYELCTEQVTIFNEDSVSKKMLFFMIFTHLRHKKLPKYRVLIFCKKGARICQYRLDDWGSIAGRDKRLFSTPCHPDRLWGPSTLLSNGY
jgi:hypothetical protein